MRDIQRRLRAIGQSVVGVEPGYYCDQTTAAVAAFQADRGLHSTGVCDEATWRAMVEAGWTLGDRLLMVAAPHIRGDDVADLQAQLAKIGFNPGRVDGIYGADTDRAFRDFQQNSGLRVDGVVGADSIRALELLAHKTGDGPGVATVRELEELTQHARSLADLRVIVGQFGGLSALARQTVQALRQRSATVVVTDEPDASSQAAAANRYRATVYLGFDIANDDRATINFFAVPQFESAGGRILAEYLHDELDQRAPQFRSVVNGMRSPVLRETRMPAVVLRLPTLDAALDQAPVVVLSSLLALERWTQQPVLSTGDPTDAALSASDD